MAFDDSTFTMSKSLNLKSRTSNETMDLFGGITVNESMSGSDVLSFGNGVMESVASSAFYDANTFEEVPSLVATEKTVFYWGD